MSMEIPETENAEIAYETRYFPVYVGSLCVDTVADFDLYLKNRPTRPPVLYRKRDLPITQDVVDRLHEHNVSTLFINADQKAEYRKYIENNLQSILSDATIEVPEKSKILYGTSQEVVKEIMDDPRSGDVIPRSLNLVNNTVRFLFEEKDAFKNLLQITSYDYYTYTHSVNVFVFSISLAQRIGFDHAPTLQEFGIGTLLHDIGKSMINPAIIRSRGGLTFEEWEVMRKHPLFGVEILKGHGVDGELSLDIVRHHHEKINGSGYPDAIKADELSPFVRISTISDIFDALTTERTYKNALESYPALTLMKNEMQDELDRDFFHVLISMMGNPDS